MDIIMRNARAVLTNVETFINNLTSSIRYVFKDVVIEPASPISKNGDAFEENITINSNHDANHVQISTRINVFGPPEAFAIISIQMLTPKEYKDNSTVIKMYANKYYNTLPFLIDNEVNRRLTKMITDCLSNMDT